jgi:hypothetical protein
MPVWLRNASATLRWLSAGGGGGLMGPWRIWWASRFFVTVLPRSPEWRNWQTRGTQNPVRLKPREGSTPSSGTIDFKNLRVFVGVLTRG